MSELERPEARGGALLSVEGLTVSYPLRSSGLSRSSAGSTVAVDRLSFDVGAGETLALVGESGCGKSTTALAVAGLLEISGGRVEAGSIRLRNRELLTLAENEWSKLRGSEISMIFQHPMSSLNPSHRVGDQIAESLLLHRAASRSAARRRTLELLDLVGFGEPARVARQFPHQLSGGMRQRVMIAIAISCEPSLLIADEPTTSLDVTLQAQILDLLSNLRKTLDMSLLLITHDLGVVSEMADRVVVLYAGELAETARTDKLLSSPEHPYTAALIRSVPTVHGPLRQLDAIPGTVPKQPQAMRGCRFAPRCPRAFERCRREHPAVYAISREQTARCFLHAPQPSGTAERAHS
ncbi:MAG: ABC transporter ATP-binding protein [Spirochaetales bacterium]